MLGATKSVKFLEKNTITWNEKYIAEEIRKKAWEKIVVNSWNIKTAEVKTNRWWLYVLITSGSCFRANPHSIVSGTSRNSLPETGTISEV